MASVGIVVTSEASTTARRGSHFHGVQFYESDHFLYDAIVAFLGEGIRRGEPLIVIAVESHRSGVVDRLRDAGINLAEVVGNGQLVLLDADEMLAKFMIDDMPDAELFEAAIGGVLKRIVATTSREPRAYGEMVDVLWRRGNARAAVRLEELWNELAGRCEFSLLCAYRMGNFVRGNDAETFARICSTHNHVAAAEPQPFGDPELELEILRQRSRALEAEVAHRRAIEDQLRAALTELGRTERALASSQADLLRQTSELERDRQRLQMTADALVASEAEQRRARAAAEASATAIARLHEIGALLCSAPLDIDTIAQRFIDEATTIVSAEHGAFFHVSTHLDHPTWVGTGSPAFALAAVPSDAVRARLFADAGLSRVDDASLDRRTMLADLPARSYLAIPITSRSGCLIGGLAFGHSEPSRFSIRHEAILANVAALAGATIDNARLYRESREACRLSELFTGVLAHDLRNPLTAIVVGLQVLEGRTTDEQTAAQLRRVSASADRMARMIEQLLDTAKLRLGGGFVLEPAASDLHEISRRVLDELQLAHRDWQFDVVADGNTNGVWDRDHLLQMFSNLAGNAIAHGKIDGGLRVRIDGTDDRAVALELTNRGAIPDAIRSHLFDPFHTLQHRPNVRGRGLGLGLFITKQIVLAHGGVIDLRSSDDTTTFVIRLPRHVERAPRRVT